MSESVSEVGIELLGQLKIKLDAVSSGLKRLFLSVFEGDEVQ